MLMVAHMIQLLKDCYLPTELKPMFSQTPDLYVARLQLHSTVGKLF